mmetsp:Transcript_92606/g.293687  ORF Transcript_92606/g.293687 Transcript_92606/m.293687 type:complete len:231 (-) Transcript_92606:2310-3002(-)
MPFCWTSSRLPLPQRRGQWTEQESEVRRPSWTRCPELAFCKLGSKPPLRSQSLTSSSSSPGRKMFSTSQTSSSFSSEIRRKVAEGRPSPMTTCRETGGSFTGLPSRSTARSSAEPFRDFRGASLCFPFMPPLRAPLRMLSGSSGLGFSAHHLCFFRAAGMPLSRSTASVQRLMPICSRMYSASSGLEESKVYLRSSAGYHNWGTSSYWSAVMSAMLPSSKTRKVWCAQSS